ncbi:unnamed protein product [Colias eurytheme]|nr:unnamed protein product [Colias eurytheme]
MAVYDLGLRCSSSFPDFIELKKDLSEAMDTSEVSLHEKLVAHTLAISDELEGRSGVWGEHSYARERGPPPHAHVRTLLQPRAPREPAGAPGERLDVVTPPRGPPAPPADRLPPSDDEDDAEEDDWERAVAAAAPGPAHARLAAAALDALRDMRLRRLAGAGGRWERAEAAAEGAARLRAALAAHWPLAGWLHGTLLALLPRRPRALYDALLAELRRAVPRLAERLAPRPPPPPPDPLDAVGEAVDGSAEGPWLAWVSSGCARQDARWRRRLGALLHVRALEGVGGEAGAGGVAGRAHAARGALGELLQAAGERPVLLGGWGAGAALAAWLARGAAARRVRGLLLLAPPLLTAEGPRDAPDDLLAEVSPRLVCPVEREWRWYNTIEVELPLLCVAGTSGAGGRGAAGALCAGPARRLLLLGGADDALRLPRRLRRRARLPQHALDAAVAEECARWAVRVCEGREAGEGEEGEGGAADGCTVDDAATTTPSGANRVIEIVEGCVVTRAAGGTPLALGARLAPADILRLPIVFADDAPAGPPPAPAGPPPLAPLSAAPLTVRAGRGAGRGVGRGAEGAGRGRGVTYTRVIVAKRAGHAPLVVRRRAD